MNSPTVSQAALEPPESAPDTGRPRLDQSVGDRPGAKMEFGLRRSDMLEGEWVQLANGEKWLIPSVDVFPHALQFSESEDGAVTACQSLDQRLVALAADLRRELNVISAAAAAIKDGDECDTIELDFMKSAGVAYRLLLLNYNLTIDIVNMSGIINERCVVPIILAGIGQKKTVLAGAT